MAGRRTFKRSKRIFKRKRRNYRRRIMRPMKSLSAIPMDTYKCKFTVFKDFVYRLSTTRCQMLVMWGTSPGTTT